jgi:hypothetical protein
MKGQIRIRRSSVFWLVTLLFAVLMSPVDAGAYFERQVLSSRTLSLGNAFVAVADDPSAAVENPAGLAQLRGFSLLTSGVKPYGLSDLEETYLAAALPVKIGVAGFSWHRLALNGVTSEDLFSLAFGFNYIRTTLDASLSFGASLDLARVSYQEPYNASESIVTGSLGVLLRPFPIIGIGYTVRNLGQGSVDFIPGGGGTPLKAIHTWGLAYHWEQVSLLYEREMTPDRQWKNHLGLEVRFAAGLSFRSGLVGGDVSGGIGLRVNHFLVDVGAAAHEELGTSYVISIGYTRTAKGADGERYE